MTTPAETPESEHAPAADPLFAEAEPAADSTAEAETHSPHVETPDNHEAHAEVEAKAPFTATEPVTVETPLPAEAQPPAEPQPPAHPGNFKLVIEQGLSINKEFLLSEADMMLGRRDPEQDFIPDIDLFDQETPNNRYISRRQARIFFKDGGMWLEDQESSNGTALNNHLIKANDPLPLKPGDKILLGQSVLLRLRRVKQ